MGGRSTTPGLERSEEMTEMPENRLLFSFLPNALSLAIMFFALAVVFFARGRKSGGGAGPPNAWRAGEPGRGGRDER